MSYRNRPGSERVGAEAARLNGWALAQARLDPERRLRLEALVRERPQVMSTEDLVAWTWDLERQR